MKNFFIPVLSLMMIVGCSKSNEVSNDELVPIKLGAGVNAVTTVKTKAPVITGNTFTAAVAGWEGATATYTVAPKWATTSEITANPAAAAITLVADQFYNSDADVKTFMKAWYPAGTLTNGVVTIPNTTGEEDFMVSDEVEGSKVDKTGKTFTFDHKTTQFKFIVKKGTGLADDITIDKIEIVDAELPTGINLVDNTLNYSPKANLTIPGITASALVIGKTVAGDAAGNPVMIKTMTGKTITLNVTTSENTFSNVAVTIDADAAFVTGKAYAITLTFTQAGISDLKASVTEWTAGTGSATIE